MCFFFCMMLCEWLLQNLKKYALLVQEYLLYIGGNKERFAPSFSKSLDIRSLRIYIREKRITMQGSCARDFIPNSTYDAFKHLFFRNLNVFCKDSETCQRLWESQFTPFSQYEINSDGSDVISRIRTIN